MPEVYQRPGPGSPNGLYLYSPEKRGWVLLDKLWLADSGVHVVYFDNTLCPACRRFDNTWFPFVEQNAGRSNGVYFMIALCDWFAKQCSSEPARRLFEIFDVHVSPTIVLLERENGKIKRSFKNEGSMSQDKLAATYLLFMLGR